MAKPRAAAAADPDPVAPPAPEPAPAGLLAVPAGYHLGWVDHEIDSVPDESGRTHKIKCHVLGLIPAQG